MKSEQDMRLKNIVVQFDLPFLVRVDDSMEPKDNLNKQYFVNLDGVPVCIRFKTMIRKHEDGINIALEDMRGNLTFSRVQVWFERHFFEVFGINTYNGNAVDTVQRQAIDYMNRFIDIYKDITGKYWLRKISKIDIRSFIIINRYWNGFEEDHTIGSLGTGRALGGPALPEEADVLLRKMLIDELVPRDDRRLYLQAIDALASENYSLAALYISIFFELILAVYIRNVFAYVGMSEAQIDDAFLGKDGSPLKTNDIIMKHVKALTGVVLHKGRRKIRLAYLKWFNKVRPLRNDLAHGKIINITIREAEECFDIVLEFVSEIRKSLKRKHIVDLQEYPSMLKD